MERSHGREFQAMSGAPIKKLPASPRVSQPSIPVADRGGEEVNVGFGDFGAGSSNQLREPGLGRSLRFGLPRIIRRKENAPEFDYSSFYGKTGTGRPTAS
jgi:hypothetical protein